MLVTLGCAADEPDQDVGELRQDKVYVMDIPIAVGQMLTWASLCFQTPLAVPHDCAVSMIEADGIEHVVPACDLHPDARPCFYLIEDLQNCPGEPEHLKIDLRRDAPFEFSFHLAIQCVSL